MMASEVSAGQFRAGEGRAEGPNPGKGKVLLVAGTHGNELNGPWLFDAWNREPCLRPDTELALVLAIGNPAARAAGRRYLDRDLNRSFDADRLADAGAQELEMGRARQLLAAHGSAGSDPCLVAIDLHSTTASMGNSLVLYGQRPADLALAAGLQGRLGLPIYLHEADAAQTGYLVERWPCGLVIEVGPVPQGVVHPTILQQTRLALASALEVLAEARSGSLRLPRELVLHQHLCSLDLPRHGDGAPRAVIHPRRQGRDWQPLWPGDPLFLSDDGETLIYEPGLGLGRDPVWPVFINEAAYAEKGIALSLTRRQCWSVQASWGTALAQVAARLIAAP